MPLVLKNQVTLIQLNLYLFDGTSLTQLGLGRFADLPCGFDCRRVQKGSTLVSFDRTSSGPELSSSAVLDFLEVERIREEPLSESGPSADKGVPRQRSWLARWSWLYQRVSAAARHLRHTRRWSVAGHRCPSDPVWQSASEHHISHGERLTVAHSPKVPFVS